MNGNPLLRTFFDTTLKERLESMESKRSEYIIKFRLSSVIFFFIIVGLMVMDNLDRPILFVVIIPFLVLFGKLSGEAKMLRRAYRTEFKQRIVKSIVRFIDPEWEYNADNCISEEKYNISEIFRKKHDRYTGDDHITGMIDRTDFECSEIHTERRKRRKSKNKKKNWKTIFRGLFFHADFHKHFLGRTFVLPNGERLSDENDESIVKLENPDFERAFSVYGTDQIEARYILTPTIMEAMLNLQRQYRNIYFSFVDSRVFCAVNMQEELFEPNLSKSGVDYSDVAKMYHLIKINTEIIEELDLNTRIWTKE